ncbi:MAG: ATP/GTP-binding protein [Methanobacteriota archaeon]|nr:MAG: ATP/GTP-binding protein [Euryarchaeota archaeon]
MSKIIYFIGTAGSGKSIAVHAFQVWMNTQGYDAITVNLDPGAENLVYNPNVDIQDWITLKEAMKDTDLGPNAAQIYCADMLALNATEVSETIKGFDTNYILVDTPGQMELFTFRESSRVIVEEFGRDDAMIVFLVDPILAGTPSGYVSSIMLSATTQFRFSIPLATILSKADLLSEEKLERILEWSKSPDALNTSLEEETGSPAILASSEFFKALESVGAFRPLLPISSLNLQGFEDLYNEIQTAFEAGEDLATD